MKLTFDEVKREQTLTRRGLDFVSANEVFDGPEFTIEDDRTDYGEVRYNTCGFLDNRLIALTWTIRDGDRRIISMRKANDREQSAFNRKMD